MKPVTTNHTVVQGVTSVTDNTKKQQPVPQPVQRRTRAQRQSQGGCKTCGQRR